MAPSPPPPAEFSVRVTPKSSQQKVVREGDLIRVYVRAAPADGEANKAVLEVLSKALGVPKTSLEVIRGHTSREKTIRAATLSMTEVIAKLGE